MQIRLHPRPNESKTLGLAEGSVLMSFAGVLVSSEGENHVPCMQVKPPPVVGSAPVFHLAGA